MNKIIEKVKSFFKTDEIVIPTSVLVIICLVITLALSGTNMLTKNKIANLEIQKKNTAMQKLISADEFKEEVITVQNDETGESTEVKYNTALKGGSVAGYIFTVATKGYGGDILVMTAVDTNGTVIAIEILDASGETPGLGQNVTKANWYSQFNGLKEGISVKKDGSANGENNEINAVTGATISSKGVTTAVNLALNYATQILEKGDKS